MRRPKFPIKKKGDVLGASHVNDLGDSVGQSVRQYPGSFVHNYVDHITGLHPWSQRIAEVQSISGLASSRTAKVKLRYYSQEDSTWLTDQTGEEIFVDLGAARLSAIPGDIALIFWDSQRDAWVPISVPMIGVGQAFTAIDAEQAGTVDVYFWSGSVWTRKQAPNGSILSIAALNTTKDVDIGAGKRVSWQWHPDSSQYLCAPLEC